MKGNFKFLMCIVLSLAIFRSSEKLELKSLYAILSARSSSLLIRLFERLEQNFPNNRAIAKLSLKN